jgi:LPXTG-motif cell wall-anchored protein
LQDGALFALGGATILAGLGFLAYRRRLTRNS